MFDKMLQIDRRIIFIFIGLAVALPIAFEMMMPTVTTPPVENIFTDMENLNKDDVILISGDYDPGSMPELYPMNLSIIKHAFLRDVKVVTINFWPAGVSLMERATNEAVQYLETQGVEKKYGEDYVHIGYKVAPAVVIDQMGNNISTACPSDYQGTKWETLELVKENKLKKLKDFAIVHSLSAGDPGTKLWVMMGQSRYGFPLAAGCTAVSAPDLYPFLNSGQLLGLMGGLRGAAEYETLLAREYGDDTLLGSASKGMPPQSIAHAVIVLFIIVGNIAYFGSERSKRKSLSK